MSIGTKNILALLSLCLVTTCGVIAQEKRLSSRLTHAAPDKTPPTPSINVSEAKPAEANQQKKLTFKAVGKEVKVDTTSNSNNHLKSTKQTNKQ